MKISGWQFAAHLAGLPETVQAGNAQKAKITVYFLFTKFKYVMYILQSYENICWIYGEFWS